MYFNKTKEEVLKELKVTSDGLTINEVKKRQDKYGLNILPSKPKEKIINIFLSEFKDPLILLLLVAIISSIFVKEYFDALAILFIVLIDALLGTYEENKANKTAIALEKLITTKVKVIRNQKNMVINAEDLTIGDIVCLESGDKIGADMRLIEVHNLVVDEAILTGESLPVTKQCEALNQVGLALGDQSNMVFSGTTVMKGRAKAVVTSIGLNTQIGRIQATLNTMKQEDSPLTKRVKKLTKQISILVLGIAIIVFILLLSKKMPFNEILLSVIALAVSAMPEGLPLSLTMALTIASNKMAKKNVIVRKLKAAESLGSCTVIASDKTGTLTINKQMAKKIVLPDGTIFSLDDRINKEKKYMQVKEIAKLGYINNEAKFDNEKINGDSIDVAFKMLGTSLKIDMPKIKVLEMIPYESENKYSVLFYEENKKKYCTVKGSLEVVKSFCSLSEKKQKEIEKQNNLLAQDGYRVIALAAGEFTSKKYEMKNVKKLKFLGLIGFIDPIRKEAIASIKECQMAGIKVLMITGDHPLTAFKIAKDLNLTNDFKEIATGEELAIELAKGQEAFDYFIKSKKVFARVNPLQKLKIVESLKSQGEYVAVTGDGVNDAPALKAANIGVAMGSGTDIARDAADMIIVDDNFKSIVEGIKEGRIAYANIRKIILFLISCGLSEVIFFCASLLLNMPMPLVAIQLLWLNVVTDGIQDLALSFEREEKGLLKEKPRSPQESIFNKELFQEILIGGIVIGIIVFLVWIRLINKYQMDIVMARGYIMALMVFIQNIHVFNCRSEHHSAFTNSIFSNKMIALAFFSSIFLQVLVMEVPILSKFLQTTSIPFMHLISLFLIALLVLGVMEIYKLINNLMRK